MARGKETSTTEIPAAKKVTEKTRRKERRAEFPSSFAEKGVFGAKLRNMRLEYAPTKFLHLTDGADDVHVAIIDDQFTGHKLNNFLSVVAPTKTEPDKDDAYGDLVLPEGARDFARQPIDPTDQYAEDSKRTIRLHRDHAESEMIGHVYREFDANNREAVITALETSIPEVDFLSAAAWNTHFIDKNYRKKYFDKAFSPPGRYDSSRALDLDSRLWQVSFSLGQYEATDRFIVPIFRHDYLTPVKLNTVKNIKEKPCAFASNKKVRRILLLIGG